MRPAAMPISSSVNTSRGVEGDLLAHPAHGHDRRLAARDAEHADRTAPADQVDGLLQRRGTPAQSKAMSARSPPVSSSRCSRSSAPGAKALSAPRARARARRPASGSTATTWPAPAMRAHWQREQADGTAAHHAGDVAHPQAAAAHAVEGHRGRLDDGALHVVDPGGQPAQPVGVECHGPGEAAVGGGPPAGVGGAGGGAVVRQVGPALVAVPQPGACPPTTRSPSLTVVTPGARSRTTPTHSWPQMPGT